MDAEVVIAGAGPTGLLLAYELGLAGVPALVLDKSPHPDEQPRANGLVGQITRVLDHRGLLHGTPLHPIAVPRFPFGPLTLELDRLETSPLHVLPVPQRALEDLLHSAATAAGATVRRGHEVTGFAQTDDGVTLDVRGLPATPPSPRDTSSAATAGAASSASTPASPSPASPATRSPEWPA
ncbi:hypothetical protein GCM10027610_045290 [Dactylosporangium cerinum]